MSETCRGHLWDKIIIKLFASSGHCVWLTTYHPCSAETSRKSGALNYPEPLGPPRPLAGHLYIFILQTNLLKYKHQLHTIFYPFFTKILIIRRHWRLRWDRKIFAFIKIMCYDLGAPKFPKNKPHDCQAQCHEFRGLLPTYYCVTLSARQKWLYINTTSNWGCHRKCTMIKHSVYKKGSLKQCITKLWVNKWLYPLSDRKRRLELCRSQLGNGSEVMHHIPWLCVPNSVHACFFFIVTCLYVLGKE